MSMQTIPVILIHAKGKRRSASPSFVKDLARSISEIGLLHPITVRTAGAEYTLVAGRHRLEAVKHLGWREINATVADISDLDMWIAEIDENLVRADLSTLERSEQFARRKELYELKHPESTPERRRADGMNRTLGRGNVAADSAATFSSDTAQKTGVSERTVREDVQIAESIPEDVRDAIRDTPLAGSKTDLLAIARLPEQQQREVIATADLSDKVAVRQAVAERRPKSEPIEAPMPSKHYTEVETTVEGFAFAAVSLFSPAECRQLISLIRESI